MCARAQAIQRARCRGPTLVRRPMKPHVATSAWRRSALLCPPHSPGSCPGAKPLGAMITLSTWIFARRALSSTGMPHYLRHLACCCRMCCAAHRAPRAGNTPARAISSDIQSAGTRGTSSACGVTNVWHLLQCDASALQAFVVLFWRLGLRRRSRARLAQRRLFHSVEGRGRAWHVRQRREAAS